LIEDTQPISHQDPLIIGTLYQMGHHLYQVLKANNIRCWLDSGGLLGAIRHKGMIPWDDDLDFCIHPDDTDKFNRLKLSGALEQVGLKIVDFWFGAKVITLKPHPKGFSFQYYSSPFIDIFFSLSTKKAGKPAIHYSSLQARNYWPNGYYFNDELFDKSGKLCEIQFGPIILPVPKEILPYIKRQYGNNCLNEAYQEHDHIHEKPIKKILYQVENPSLAKYVFWDGLPAINNSGN